MRLCRWGLIGLCVVMLSAFAAPAYGVSTMFARSRDCGLAGVEMNCRLWEPDTVSAGTKYPLIVYLHGAGQAGYSRDPARNQELIENTQNWAAKLTAMVSDETGNTQGAYFVMMPQAPNSETDPPGGGAYVHWDWSKTQSYSLASTPETETLKHARAMLESVKKQHPIDADRVYVVGSSMGGFGTWDLIARNPGLFAAGLPNAGGGPPDAAAALRTMAVWSHHADRDGAVPPNSDRDMFKAIALAGGRPLYTEAVSNDHSDQGNLGQHFFTWMLAQRRGVPPTAHPALNFDPPGGAFKAPVKVSIKSDEGNAIRYTLDGTVPSPSHGLVYKQPFEVADSAIVMAMVDSGERKTFHAAPFAIGGQPLPHGAVLVESSAPPSQTPDAGDQMGTPSETSAGGAQGGAEGGLDTNVDDDDPDRASSSDDEAMADMDRARSGGCSMASGRAPPQSALPFVVMGLLTVLWRGRRASLRLAGFAVLTAACTGHVDQQAPPDQPEPSNPAEPGGAVQGCETKQAFAPARLWRLSDEQYVNAVRDLFGVTVGPEISGVRVDGVSAVDVAELGIINSTNAGNYQIAARAAADKATANLSALLPCGTDRPEEACVKQFISSKVPRAFRRPIEPIEAEELLELYRLGAAQNAQTGVRLVLEAVLQSPFFLWRTELGNAADAKGPIVDLTSYELASALSFFLLDSLPDDALWKAAEAGTLKQPATLEKEVDRLLGTPEVQQRLTKRAAHWLGLGRLQRIAKDPAVFTGFNEDAKAALIQSGERFVDDMLWQGGGLADLFRSRRLYVNEALASFYDIQGVVGTELVAKEGGAERAGGVLTQPSVLAAASGTTKNDVVHRGLFIYDQLLCGLKVPPPPPAVVSEIQATPKDAPERELAAARAKSGTCAGCHAVIDPLGLAAEPYDAIGRFRKTDPQGAVVDQSSFIVGLDPSLDGPVDGLLDLAGKLEASPRASACAVTHLAAAVLGRDLRGEESCALSKVQEAFATSGDFPKMFRSLLTSPAFMTRSLN